ncbi:uncharacterized protein BcabD6B2_56810 [Babesia caballi]|uniref:Uncharacterized protein n=1 Tax=Babesia caballi TaxID=5871 RepID=A0AAV4M306_BABCB|nr:conserved hypothetical protein [Babesia caballi]
MADLWNLIKKPENFKAMLEFLTVLRTTLELRNATCHVLMKKINQGNKVRDPSRIGAFHEFLDIVTELRARLIGQQGSFDYGAYKNLQSARKKLHVCRDQNSFSRDCGGLCTLNIDECAEAIADIIIPILPELYITLISVWIKLIRDNRCLSKNCNDSSGVLYRWLINNEALHTVSACPYFNVSKSHPGFNHAEIQSKDPTYKIKEVIEKLVGYSGCLRTLILMMKRNKYEILPDAEFSIETLQDDFYKCMCIPVQSTGGEDANSVTQRRSARRINSSFPRTRSRRNASTRGPNANKSVTAGTVTTESRKPPQASSNTTDVQADVAVTAPGNHDSVSSSAVLNTQSAGTSSPVMGYRNQNDVLHMWYHKNSSHSNTLDYNYYMQDSFAGINSKRGSSCAASGAAVGCLLVGCVGVGAAYGFNIGGFGTMVNSLF